MIYCKSLWIKESAECINVRLVYTLSQSPNFSFIRMASQSHCPIEGVRSVHECNATPFLRPGLGSSSGYHWFPAPDNAVSLSALSLTAAVSQSELHVILFRKAIYLFFICVYCKELMSFQSFLVLISLTIWYSLISFGNTRRFICQYIFSRMKLPIRTCRGCCSVTWYTVLTHRHQCLIIHCSGISWATIPVGNHHCFSIRDDLKPSTPSLP